MAEILVTSLDQGSSFVVNYGDVIVICLEENITTGYQWAIDIADTSMFELLESDYSSSQKEGFLGAPGTRTFRFRAKLSGSERIQLRLRRPWEPVDKAIETFEVNVQVR